MRTEPAVVYSRRKGRDVRDMPIASPVSGDIAVTRDFVTLGID